MQRKQPFVVKLAAGTHYICQCGSSNNRPFCDGSHNDPGEEPYALEISEDKEVALCGCLNSGNLPWCDGSHSKVV